MKGKNIMSKEKTCETCTDSSCSASQIRSGESEKDFQDRQKLAMRMCRIQHKIIVLSGKGGVGKSTVAVNLAVSLAMKGAKVGLVDVDIHGPSIPTLLNLEGYEPEAGKNALLPIPYTFDHYMIKVMSIGFFFQGQQNAAVIWRGPLKMSAIRQFLSDVEWGELDYLIIDSPPGTGDEPLSICQLIEGMDGAVIVTTPQEVAIVDVKRSITFCHQLKLPVLGVIENMSGMICPKCGETIEHYKTGSGQKMAAEMNVPFLGRLPIDPQVMLFGDEGKPFVSHMIDSEAAKAFEKIVKPIMDLK
jgi:Mrp family chromosome partitioning ATPase